MTDMNDKTPTWTARPVGGHGTAKSSHAQPSVVVDAASMPDDSALGLNRRTPLRAHHSNGSNHGPTASGDESSADSKLPETSDRQVATAVSGDVESTRPQPLVDPKNKSSSGLVMLVVVGVAMLVVLGLGVLISAVLTSETQDAVAVAQDEELDESVSPNQPLQDESSNAISADDSEPSTTSDMVAADAANGSSADQFGTVAEAYAQSAYARLDGLSLYLEGTVPSQEVGDEVEARAAVLLGKPAVKANYEIDPSVELPADPPLFATSAVLFEPDGSVNSGSMGTLNLAFSLLADYPEARVIVTAPAADQLEVGQVAANETQANAVMQFWIEKGLDPERVQVEVRKPSASDPEADGVLEREIEFVVRGLLETDQL